MLRVARSPYSSRTTSNHWADQLPPIPRWQNLALCSLDPPPLPHDAFFSQAPTTQLRAKLLCQSCPARLECLAFFLREKYGVYGGLDPLERRRIVDQVRKGRKIPDVLVKVDKRVREQAQASRVKAPKVEGGLDVCMR